MSRGFVVWFTGLSGSGKSTLTAMLAAELRARGTHVETLDGDAVRRHLSKGLGFSREDRDANIRRIGFVARLVARSGGCAIAAAISPYTEIRNEIRRSMDRFCEVYTECPLDVLAERDPKGLYKKALAGEIKNFTGVDDPYQAPEAPEVHLRTDHESPEQSVAKIVTRLEELGFIAARTSTDLHDVWQGLSRPHGDDLVDRLLRGDLASEVRARASTAPSITLGPSELANVGAIATGLFSPLKGFTTSKDQPRILDAMRLETGVPWAVPITLRTSASRLDELRAARVVALRDGAGTLVATLTISDVWRPDTELEHAALSGSGAPRGPDRNEIRVGGELECFVAPSVDHLGSPASPRDIRVTLQRLDAHRVVALPSTDVPDLGSEHVLRCILELGGVAVVLVGGSVDDRVAASTRAACWWAVLSKYFPPGRALVATYPLLHGLVPERAALHTAVVAQNLGCTHLALPPELGETIPHAAELTVQLRPIAPMGFSKLLGHPASHRTAPDVPADGSARRIEARRPEVDAILSGRTRTHD